MELVHNLNISKQELNTLKDFFNFIDELDLEDGNIWNLLDYINNEEPEVYLSLHDSNTELKVSINYQD